MKKEDEPKICPVEKAGGLDNSIRKFLQNPQRLLMAFIKPGMTVLDVGCGPGFFTVEISKMLANSGKVIAADLQEGMLDIIRQKIKGTALEQRVELHKCKPDRIDLSEKVDFVLAFYMIHELPSKENALRELKTLLNPQGQILIIEPKGHVTKKSFNAMTELAQEIGFNVSAGPKVFFSRSVILTPITS